MLHTHIYICIYIALNKLHLEKPRYFKKAFLENRIKSRNRTKRKEKVENGDSKTKANKMKNKRKAQG